MIRSVHFVDSKGTTLLEIYQEKRPQLYLRKAKKIAQQLHHSLHKLITTYSIPLIINRIGKSKIYTMNSKI